MPTRKAAFGAANGHSKYGKTRGSAVMESSSPVPLSAVRQYVVLVHRNLGAIWIPATVTKHGVDPERAVVRPYIDPSRSPHGHGRMLAEVVPTDRIVQIDQRRHQGHVLRMAGHGAVAQEAAGAVAEARADAPHVATGCILHSFLERPADDRPIEPKANPAISVDPARSSSKKVERRSLSDFVWKLPGDGGAELAAGSAVPRSPASPGAVGVASMLTISRSSLVYTTSSARLSSVGSPESGREKVPAATLQAQASVRPRLARTSRPSTCAAPIRVDGPAAPERGRSAESPRAASRRPLFGNHIFIIPRIVATVNFFLGHSSQHRRGWEHSRGRWGR